MAGDRHIDIKRNGSRPSVRGPAQSFTGSAIVDPLFEATEHTHATGALVTFEPGARTAWHTHPAGQTLIVTAGVGWVQQSGGEPQQIQPGSAACAPQRSARPRHQALGGKRRP